MSNSISTATAQLEGRLKRGIATVKQWEEDPELLKFARAQIPYQELVSAESKYARPDDRKYCHPSDTDLLLLKRLALWFKEDYMQWVNEPKCSVYPDSKVVFQGVVSPETADEVEGGASRVELYKCTQSGTILRFPRYNKVKKLMETRQGRCGEFANLFGFFCKALGFDTRYVLDFTDHVWTEVWSARLDRYIMADSCEGKIDEPCMYEKGWGKKLNFVFGIGSDSVFEITKRYTRNFNSSEFHQRRASCLSISIDSAQLNSIVLNAVNSVDSFLKSSASAARINELHRRKSVEKEFFEINQTIPWSDDGMSEGRISGSLSWKLSRGEAGDLTKQVKNHEEKKNDGEVVLLEPFLATFPGKDMHIDMTIISDDKIDSSNIKGAISINGITCSLDEKGLNVVIVDGQNGCVLQRGVFQCWNSFQMFIDRIPSGRLVFLSSVGNYFQSSGAEKAGLKRLFKLTPTNNTFVYAGQIGAKPDWCTIDNESLSLKLLLSSDFNNLKLESRENTFPAGVITKIPESFMSLESQVAADEIEKEKVAREALRQSGYAGFCIKDGHPIYLFNPSCFPFQHASDSGWTSFHYLPQQLVRDEKPKEKVPLDYPCDYDFLLDLVGEKLMKQSMEVHTTGALLNKRLVGLYFSAHWCPPCRRFTPMLAQFFEDHKEENADDLEIIFVSSDRDIGSFSSYYASMPWSALPFTDREQKDKLSRRFGVRGIPALIILDTISGEVVAQQHSREDVLQCRGDVQAVVSKWLQSRPESSKELLTCLEESLDVDDTVEREQEIKERNEYLFESKKNASVTSDVSTEIKKIFEEFVNAGEDPNAAAAKAISIVGEKRKHNEFEFPLGKGQLVGEILEKRFVRDYTFDSFLNGKYDKDQVLFVAATVKKYIKNALKEPFNNKYRSVRIDNKIFGKIVEISFGLKLLSLLGFATFSSIENYYVSIPLASDINEIQAKVITIEKAYL